jgi:hypothetical protein
VTASRSGCWLPAAAVEVVALEVVTDIDRKRHQYVSDAVTPLLQPRQTWLQRFMGVAPSPAFKTREEAAAYLRGCDYGLGLFCEHAHATQRGDAARLLALARATLECRDGAEMFVTAEDFDYIADKWST